MWLNSFRVHDKAIEHSFTDETSRKLTLAASMNMFWLCYLFNVMGRLSIKMPIEVWQIMRFKLKTFM